LKTIISPNFNDRAEGTRVDWIIVHYTDIPTLEESLDILTSDKSQVSAHYLVGEEGETLQLVDEEKRAWHAGQSYWRGVRDLNSHTIGIEIQNPGHSHGYREFPQKQMDAVMTLCKDIQSRHKLGADCLWGHSDIAPTRKQDPGHLFPWRSFAKEGLGLWPHKINPKDVADEEALNQLLKIGYDPDCPQDSIMAFQRHFRPHLIDRILDPKTKGLIESVFEILKERP